MNEGRFTLGAGRDYDGTKLAADDTVVVTINFRHGALGFLAHPALAVAARRAVRQLRADGPAGCPALGAEQHQPVRWRHPHNVTIAGQSSGGLSVLAHLVSLLVPRGLFQRAIVQSGSFALTQQSLATAEAGR